MKLLSSSLLIASLSSVYAGEPNIPFSPNLRGIQIISISERHYSEEAKKRISLKEEEEKRLGYRLTEDDPGAHLRNFIPYANQQYAEQKFAKPSLYDTHLKKNISQINLSFPFNGIPVNEENIIGYAPVGTYIKEKGWDGVRVFFTSEMGICSFQRDSILAVQLVKEKLSYEVNNKPTTKSVRGNPNSGFLYSIDWHENDSVKALECANKTYEPNIMTKMLILANEIDKKLS